MAPTRRKRSPVRKSGQDAVWDQHTTLKPPPYRGEMRRLLAGLELGDDPADALPIGMVSPCVRFRQAREPIPAVRAVKQRPEPEWVDWNLVREGQQIWCQHLGRTVFALQAVLLQGFTIGRFAEVLHQAGYAQNPLTTMKRYTATLLILTDWLRYPLDEADSPARLGLYAVRCMHSFARRRTGHVFDRSAGEGIALSQYDLAEVLLGFTGACLAIMENDMGMGRFDVPQRRAMVHTWRLIGWHLGILDEFNVCESVARVDACWADYMEWTPQRLTTCRPATHTLQHAVMRAFGRHLGMGEAYWSGFIKNLENVCVDGIRYVQVEPMPGMAALAGFGLRRLGASEALNSHVRRAVERLSEVARVSPARVDFLLVTVHPRIARVNDILLWPLYALLFSIARALRWWAGDKVAVGLATVVLMFILGFFVGTPLSAPLEDGPCG